MQILVNDIALYYEKLGTGCPMILLHGNGEDHHIFDKLSEKLKNDFTIYMIDSRNHGQSSKINDFSYEIMAEDIFVFIEKLKLHKANIVGFSDGAIIALILAMKHEEIVSKMALLGINLKPSDFTNESYKYLKDSYEQTKDPLLKLMLEQPNIELEEVKNLNVPTLILAAQNDIFKPETFTNLANALPNATLKIMNNHEHDSYIVNNDILYWDFVDFFK